MSELLNLNASSMAAVVMFGLCAAYTGCSRYAVTCGADTETTPAAMHHMQVIVEACDPLTAPAVIYDAGYSSDPSGRKLTSFVWSQETLGTMNPVLQALIDDLNSGTGDVSSKAQLKISQTTITQLGEGDYTLTVTVKAFLGQVATAKLTFSKQPSGAVPVVSIVGGQSQLFKVSEGLKVASYLQPTSVCGGKEVCLATSWILCNS